MKSVQILDSYTFGNLPVLKWLIMTCTEVMDPFLVVVILSCMLPMSVARVGW